MASRKKDWSKAPAVKSREVLGPTDDSPSRYMKAVNAAESADQLRDELARWPVLAADAYEQATATGFDWQTFLAGMASERSGRFAGEDFAREYGAILMPKAMIEPAMVAARFHVPFGLAYIRTWEASNG